MARQAVGFTGSPANMSMATGGRRVDGTDAGRGWCRVRAVTVLGEAGSRVTSRARVGGRHWMFEGRGDK